jgi:hypothetical protein
VPDVAPLLTLGAVTGMGRGELVTVRRSRLHPDEGQLTGDAATDGKRVKPTKSRKERKVAVDPEGRDMLLRHYAHMDERAEPCGLKVAPDAFVFSLALDCSAPMPPDYVTTRVALLKEHLGIANKRAETIALEDEEQDPEERRVGGQRRGDHPDRRGSRDEDNRGTEQEREPTKQQREGSCPDRDEPFDVARKSDDAVQRRRLEEVQKLIEVAVQRVNRMDDRLDESHEQIAEGEFLPGGDDSADQTNTRPLGQQQGLAHSAGGPES